MFKWLKKYFWTHIAKVILRGRYFVLIGLLLITYLFSTQWKYNQFDTSEARLLPKHHAVSIEYEKFLKTFGEEGNLIVIGIKDSALFTSKNFEAWNLLNKKLRVMPEFENVLSTENLKILHKDKKNKRFEIQTLINQFPKSVKGYNSYKKKLLKKLPFYEGLVYNKSNVIRSLLFLDKEIVNTNVRRDFILNELLPLIKNFEKDTGLKIHISGMPYIRTVNTQLIINEVSLFIVGSILITSLFLFFFFRSLRATLISIAIVIIGVMWSFGTMGFLHYKITVLTALIPPLIIVIGIPNCIFLINKYHQEIHKNGNKIKSLSLVISKVGNATLMTNLTTALGFGTFIFTDSNLLKEFGVVAFLNIMFVFMLSIIIIPSLYSLMKKPKVRHLKHLNSKWIKRLLKWIENTVRHHRVLVYIVSICVLILGIIGSYKIQISGSLLDDIPKNKPFARDILFFEKEFEGVLPVEITINTKHENGVTKLSTLRKIDKLQKLIEEIPEFSKPISIVNLAKYAKQTFYNSNPKYYELPSTQESSFILSYVKNSSNDIGFLDNFVDSKNREARIMTMMKNMDIKSMDYAEDQIKRLANKEFPKERYEISITGKPLVFAKGTKYLVKNLFVSLLYAIGIIALIMALLFRSFRMIVISLIPNLLPLIATAGIMGFFGIPLKPSTILVFSIAFGISVDDTLHFLAKYRQELRTHNWRIAHSVYAALKETGMSMFYTSIVLFFGFSIFITSSFGGTIALGGLVSMTLLFAMMTNLVLLPALLISLEKIISNKKILKQPIESLIVVDEDEDK